MIKSSPGLIYRNASAVVIRHKGHTFLGDAGGMWAPRDALSHQLANFYSSSVAALCFGVIGGFDKLHIVYKNQNT